MTTAKHILKQYGIFIVVGLILILCTGSYFAGYRIDQGGITRVGTVTLIGLPEQTAVYIDQSRRVRASSGTVELALTPGTHSVIVDSPNNQPWNEVFGVTTSGNTVLAPIFVPVTPEKTLILGADQTRANETIRATTLPTKILPLYFQNNCVAVYVFNGRIVAEATNNEGCVPPPYLCAPESPECAPTVVFSPAGPLHSVLPFPGRSDALVISAGTLVYSVEIDPREPQFFAPLFKGSVTGAMVWDDTSIAVTNGKTVVVLPLPQ